MKMTCKSKHNYIKDDRGVPYYLNYYECKNCGKTKVILLKKKLPSYMEINSKKRKYINSLKKTLLKARNVFVSNLQQRIVLIEKANSVIYLETFTNTIRTNKKNESKLSEYFVEVNQIQ